MTLGFAFFTFLNAFWIMAFIAIAFSVKYEKPPENPIDGYVAAPSSIDWKKAIIIDLLLSTLVTLALKLFIG